jgi:hypothetical protein
MPHDELKLSPEALPIACTLSDTGEVEARRTSIEDIFAGVTEKHELTDGYEFVFSGDDHQASQLMRFVETERKCCPFFIFELVFEQANGPIHLRLRGATGIKDFLSEWMKALP